MCSGAVGSVARADATVLLPVAGDADAGQREAAEQAVREFAQAQGMRIVDDRQLNDQGLGCSQISCAPALLASAHADLAIAVAVWKGTAPVVNVTLVDARGGRYPAQATVSDGDTADAARTALLDARGLHLLGPGPWVRITGSPEGATVVIDREAVGALPYRGALEPGDHSISVEAEGYEPHDLSLSMPLDPTRVADVDISLVGRAPQELESVLMDEPQEPVLYEASPWNYVLGGVLIAGGVALATIDPVRAAIKDGECVDDDCDEVYHFGSRSVLEVAVGAAVASAGIAVLIWQPVRVRAEVSTARTQLSVEGQF